MQIAPDTVGRPLPRAKYDFGFAVEYPAVVDRDTAVYNEVFGVALVFTIRKPGAQRIARALGLT